MTDVTNSDIYEMCKVSSIAKEGHLASALSVIHILNVVYSLCDIKRNTFILSKGHASLGLYVILKKYGYLTEKQFATFCEYDSILGGHPNYLKVPGIFGSTGSLGHGLPLAIGKALGLKAKKSNSKIIVLLGDGELNEGSNWEALLLAAHHQLNNLTCIVDFNKSSERALTMVNVPNAVKELGWSVEEIDGHDELSIERALNYQSDIRPTFIWANTVKGKGISFMEGNPEWHHKSPTDVELEKIAKELGIA